MMWKVGIVGAGNIAQIHGQCWSDLPVRLQGWFDVVPAAALRAAQTWGGAIFDSLEDLLADCDIVDICTSVQHHRDVVWAAADRGKAIVCEKPLARTVADCEEIVAYCKNAEVRLFVAHVVRFFPQFVAARETLLSGQLGKPATIRTVRAFGFPGGGHHEAAQPYGDLPRSGGVVLDVAIHDIDYQRWCLGEVERVFARGLWDAGIPQTDHALIVLRFASGAIGHIEASWAHKQGLSRTHLEIAGTQGIVEWDSRDKDPLEMATVGTGGVRKLTPYPGQDHPWHAELSHFVQCLESGEPFRVSPVDGLMAVKIAEAALHSIRTGRPVHMAKFRR